MPKIIGIPKPRFNTQSKIGTTSEVYIILLYRYQFNRKTVTVKYSISALVNPKYWDAKAGRAKFNRTHPEYVDLNKRLNEIENIVVQIYKDFSGSISPEDFKKELDYRFGKKERPEDAKSGIPTLFEFIESFLNDGTYQLSTFKKYSTTFNHLKNYAQDRGVDLTYDAIDWKFKADFLKYLYAPPRNMSANTAVKMLGIVKLFLKTSHQLKYHTNEIYKETDFREKAAKTKNKVRLSLEELDALLSLDLSNNTRLEKARDLFIVGAFSGLRFSDWHKITRDQLFATPDGEPMLRVMAEKTRKYTAIPLFPELAQILEKYNYSLPTISSQKFNAYIKEVVQIAFADTTFLRIYSEGGQIKNETIQKWEAVSSHAARRSFVSNFLQLEISPSLIMAITGHSTEKQLYAYADVEADELAATFGKKATIALEQHRAKVKRIG